MNSNTSHSDIVCFSLARWDAPISSPAVSLAKEFSKTARVFFIQHPYSFKDRLREKGKPTSYSDGNVTVIVPPSTYPVNFLPAGKVYNFFAGLNERRLLRTLRQLFARENIVDYIFINFFDPFFFRHIPADIRPAKYVYQCMDDISQVAYTRRHGLRLEEELIRKVDATICTSRELTRLKSPLSEKVFYLPNGADTDLFSKAFRGEFERPADLPGPGRRIIGFTGSIEYRTDFELLRKTAEAHAEKVIFLIGPVHGDEHVRLGITGIPNVIFAGARPIESLPAYLQFFDCAIIPYKKNVLTSSIYPLKINEYLAAGKAVVTTSFSEDIRAFSDVATIAASHDDFIRGIDAAIADDSASKRLQRANVAAGNSWAKRVEEFRSIISQR